MSFVSIFRIFYIGNYIVTVILASTMQRMSFCLGMRREDLAVHVRRDAVFEDSFRELHRRSAEEWKNRFYIVFEGNSDFTRFLQILPVEYFFPYCLNN